MAFTIVGLNNSGQLNHKEREDEEQSIEVYVRDRRQRSEIQHLLRKQLIFESHFANQSRPTDRQKKHSMVS